MADCPILDGAYLLVNTTERTLGTVVGLTCEEGYRLVGIDTLHCTLTGLWSDSIPRCLQDPEESGSSGLSSMIIGVSIVASLIAAVVLAGSIYMLVKSCQRERDSKLEKEAMDKRMHEISLYISSNFDHVGMPAIRDNNIHPPLTGRTASVESSIEQDEQNKNQHSEADDFMF